MWKHTGAQTHNTHLKQTVLSLKEMCLPALRGKKTTQQTRVCWFVRYQTSRQLLDSRTLQSTKESS